jgi:hypothetical protein
MQDIPYTRTGYGARPLQYENAPPDNADVYVRFVYDEELYPPMQYALPESWMQLCPNMSFGYGCWGDQALRPWPVAADEYVLFRKYVEAPAMQYTYPE